MLLISSTRRNVLIVVIVFHALIHMGIQRAYMVFLLVFYLSIEMRITVHVFKGIPISRRVKHLLPLPAAAAPMNGSMDDVSQRHFTVRWPEP